MSAWFALVRMLSIAAFSSSSLCAEGTGGGAGGATGVVGRNESSFAYNVVKSVVEFDDERSRLISSTVCVSRSFDSTTCFRRLSSSVALSFDRRINVCRVVRTVVVVVEMVLSWSAIEPKSC